MQVCPQCAGQGCAHCAGKGYHGHHPMGNVNSLGHCNCAHPDCPSCKQQQLGFITINKNTGAGISVLSGIAGAFILPMLTGGFNDNVNTNRKIRNAAVGFITFGVLGGLGSYGVYQIQN